MAAPRRIRSALRWIHRWLGLTVGLILVAIALSGSLLLFQPQYFEWAHGHMIPDDLAEQPGSIDAWVEKARAAAPGLGEPVAIWRPHVSHNVSDAGMLIFAGLEPGGLGNMGLLGVLVAPATGDVLGTFEVDHSPAYAPIFFHRDLWAGATGRALTGVVALTSLIALSLGLYLWWPRRTRLWRKLSPSPWRATFFHAVRLHDWLGIWTLLALLVLIVSGLYLAQPGWVEPALALLPDTPEERAIRDGPCGPAIGFDAALARARELVPNSTWTAIYSHEEAGRGWEIALKAGDGQGDVRVLADLRCARLTLFETDESRSVRETTELWLVGLHEGTAFGRTGVIVVTLLGCAPVVLYVTGTIAWWRKRKARRSG